MAAHSTQPARGPARPRDAGLAPSIAEVAGIAGVWAFYMLSHELFGREGCLAANLAGPLLMTAILATGAWRLLRLDGRNVWTALFWFRVSTGLYFGIGTFAVFAANNFTRLYIEAFYQFFDDEIFKLNLIVSLSVALVLLSARAAIAGLGRNDRQLSATITEGSGDRGLPAVGAAFLFIGLAITWGMKVPQDLGWTTGEWSGAFLGLSRLTMVGIFMLTLWSLEHARWFLPVVTLIGVGEMSLQLVLLAKTGVILTLLLYLLAFLWEAATVRRITVCAAVILLVFIGLQPVVGHARQELALGQSDQAGLGRRIEALLSVWAGGPEGDEDERQSALLRISYVNAATLVIRQYDIGVPGEWPRLLPAVLVPRFLWPDKPIVSDVGLDIYELGTGQRTSSAGAGVYAESYWAMGWWGVVICMPVYGLILGVLTHTTARLLRQRRWLLFPVVLLSMVMGLRSDGHFITDVAGASVIIACMYVLLLGVERLGLSLPRRTSANVVARASDAHGRSSG